MQAIQKKSKSISAIWILPIIAAIICATLLYKSYTNAGVLITLELPYANGITAGKTQVRLRGIPVGLVEKLTPNLANNKVRAQVRMETQVKEILLEDTIFWVVRPQLSASSVSGLETIFSGSYITMQPGRSSTHKRHFIASDHQPPPPSDTPGLHLTLHAERLGSLQVGSGIYYKNFQIGVVEQTQLVINQDSEKNNNLGSKNSGEDFEAKPIAKVQKEAEKSMVHVKILIEPDFTHLVHKGSRFFDASGIELQGNLPNFSVKIESFAALLRGGIQLYTPQQLSNTAPAVNGDIFTLYRDFSSADYGSMITIDLHSSKGIVEGVTKVIYQGVVFGVVKRLELDKDDMSSVIAHIQLDPRAQPLLRENTQFWLVRPEVDAGGVRNLELLISGGYITFLPGDGEFCTHFKIRPTAPPQPPARLGKSFRLRSNFPVQMGKGAPVTYKNIEVGKIVSVAIDKDGRDLFTDIYIYKEYLHLVNSSSVFWLNSGIRVKADAVKGVALETGPLASVLFGGIAFMTPSNSSKKNTTKIFPLYRDFEAAIAATPVLHEENGYSGRTIQIIAENAKSLAVGAPILYNNIRIGEIKGLSLKNSKKIRIIAEVEREYQDFITDYTRFYRSGGVQVSAGLDGIKLETDSMLAIAAGGIACVDLPGKAEKKEGAWLLYKSKEDAKNAKNFIITVTLPSSFGLKKGSAMLYKGIRIGTVTNISFTDKMEQVLAKVSIESSARNLFRKGTMIWLDEGKISIKGVKNPQALVLGPTLAILPGKGEKERDFLLLTHPPLAELANLSGKGFVLESSHLGSLSEGSPVYYREVKVGEVTGYTLSPSFQKVQIFISIRKRYQDMIRQNTRFWNVSGMRIEGGIFSGIHLQAGSMQSILSGGIAFATPDSQPGQLPAPKAPAGFRFTLYQKAEESWLDWKPDIQILQKEEALPVPQARVKK